MAVSNDLNLDLVQVIFRHGARTLSTEEAMVINPEDINESEIKYYGFNQLTNHGKAQAYDLGCALRDRYNDFLGETYHPDDVYARSSDYDRTKMSLQLALAGLYPPVSRQIWNPDLRWMPIPYHYVTGTSDTMLLPFAYMKYQAELREIHKLPSIKKKISKYQELIRYLLQNKILVKEKYANILGLIGVFNLIHVQRTAKLPLPDKYTDNLFQTIKSYIMDFVDIMSWTTQLRKFNGGPLLKQCLENINLNNEKENSKKIYLYCGHDLTLTAFLKAHNINDFDYPNYSSAVVLEKFRNSRNNIYVRILSWDGKEFNTLKLGNFEDLCPFSEYIKIIKNVIPTDEELDLMLNGGVRSFMNMYEYDSIF